MRFPLTNCPKCNALERLVRKERRIGDGVYVYTRCGTCRTEFPIAHYTAQEERDRKRADRERRRQIRATYGIIREPRT